MAEVPTAEQTIFPEQGVQPNASGTDFGSQVGEATAGLGKSLSDTGDTISKDVLQWQDLKNTATAQDLAVQFQGDLGKIEEGYYGLSGKAAADAYPKFQSDVDALQQKYLGASPNPMVANMVGGTVKFSVGRSLLSGGRYAGEQTKSWMIDSADGHAQMLAYQAAQKWDDPNFRDTAFAGIDASAADLGAQKNWSTDTTKLYAQKWKDESDKNALEARKKFIQSKPAWEVISALGGGDAAGGGAQPTAMNIDDVAAVMRGKEGDTRGYKTPGGGVYQVHGGPVDENSTPAEQDAFFKTEFPKRMDQLASNLGHQVTQADGSLAWQQGVGGAAALLKNPDENVVAVLRPFYVTQKDPSGLAGATAAVKNNGGSPTETASAFTQHVKGYYGLPDTAQPAGQTTLTPSQMAQSNSPGENAQIKAAFDALPPDEQQAMRKSVLDNWNSQNAAARADTNFQQEQQAKAEKADYDNKMAAVNRAIEANFANPQKAPPVDFSQLAQTQFFKEHPEALPQAMAYRDAVFRKDTDPNLSAHNTSQLFGKMFPSDGSAPLTQQAIDAALVSQGPDHINREDHDWLTQQLSDAKDPTAKRTNGQLNDVAKVVERQIDPSFTGAMGSADHSPFSGTRMLQWKQAVAEKIAAFKAAGKDPAILFDPSPSNNDYVGSAGFIAPYTRSLSDLMTEEATGQESAVTPVAADAAPAVPAAPAAAPAASAVPIPSELPKGTTYYGKTKDGRDVFLQPDGRKMALPAAAPTPVAAAGPPDVPSGE